MINNNKKPYIYFFDNDLECKKIEQFIMLQIFNNKIPYPFDIKANIQFARTEHDIFEQYWEFKITTDLIEDLDFWIDFHLFNTKGYIKKFLFVLDQLVINRKITSITYQYFFIALKTARELTIKHTDKRLD